MEHEPAIIPLPHHLSRQDGELTLDSNTGIFLRGHAEGDLGELLAAYLRPATGWPIPVRRIDEAGDSAGIILHQTGVDQPDASGFQAENYRLTVTTRAVRIDAATSHGLARGIQTLRQLLPPPLLTAQPQPDGWRIPCVTIADQPRFRWRGMMIDVARHFFTVEEVCRFIDLIALHRFNRLHLHLTDDQGWRIEIKRYPRLTEIGGVRQATVIGHECERPQRYDDRPYGGFYTQDDIRRLVAFARQRRIELVPEIDFPGHMQAAIAAYPELGNTDATIRPRCHWGISRHILNPQESTITFVQNVLEEVMELFPGLHLHVGGDEAIKIEWQECRQVQERMRDLGVKNEDELQSWLINRIGRFIAARGRKMVGWDEILEGGGLAPDAIVMSWRGEKGGIEAAQAGHDVVMATKTHTYFDYYQAEPTTEEPLAIGGLCTADHVYSYEPIPAILTDDQKRHVLGAQGQLWAEYIPDAAHLEYMAFPRACALAEVLWLDPAAKNFRDFLRRLDTHRQRLQALGVNAHPRP